MFDSYKPEKARIVIALAMQKRIGVVVATDSEWVECEVDGISAYTDDIGILKNKDYENDPGLYLWEGMLKIVVHGALGEEEEPETEYEGKLRKIEAHEMEELLAMTPPEPPDLSEYKNATYQCQQCGADMVSSDPPPEELICASCRSGEGK